MGYSRLSWSENYERPLEPPSGYLQAKAWGECACCGETIYEGEEYWDIDGETYCDDCVRLKVAGE